MAAVRKAVAADVSILLPLVKEYWRFEGLAGFDSARLAIELARLLSDPRLGSGWIVFIDGQAAGYLLAVHVFSLEHLGLTAEIDEFFVLPQHRGRGLGNQLLEAAEAGFREAGFTNVSLQLARGNSAAREFYRRHGYLERAGFELLEKMLKPESGGRVQVDPRHVG